MHVINNQVETLIADRQAELHKPGVLAVRSGYEITDGWFTGRPAIVVTVRRKRRSVPADALLPTHLDGIAVDVRQASPRKRQELQDPTGFAEQLRLAPDTGSMPHFADERTPTGIRPAAAASAHAALAKIPKPQLGYTAPEIMLEPITADATVRLCASPDSGWPVLSQFLAATQSGLTVGMYDFTSQHVAEAVEQALAGKHLRLTLDHPPLDKTADESDADTVADLRESLGAGFTQAWALTRLDRDATAWIYPTSYHIKVAVRDASSTWLSTGNWNNSNQPAIDPATAGLTSPDADEARHRDRDWHVVIDQPQLADVFAGYLTDDLSVAVEHNAAADVPAPPLMPPPLPASRTPVFKKFFPPAELDGPITITPLLTPDPGVYVAAVKALIASATTTLRMQFQYIELPKAVDATSQAFVDLVDTVIDRQNNGVDVRIICSQYETAGYLEQLIARGLDVKTVVKIQDNVHNKGINADADAVLISSQNWSTDGTLYNRDAGVILHDPRAAAYFSQIFDHDWTHLAHYRTQSD